MTAIKNKNIIDYIYYALWILLSAAFVFEAPGIVFIAPTVLFGVWGAYSICKKIQLHVPVGALLLLLFCVLYVGFTYDPSKSVYYQSYILLQTAFLFTMGSHFFAGAADRFTREKELRSYILLLCIFYIIYTLVTYAVYLKDPLNVPAERKYWSIWYPGEVEKTATAFGASLLPGAAWGAYAVFFEKSVWKKILGGGIIAFCFGFNLLTGTRLPVLFTPVLLAAGFLLWLVFHKRKIRAGIVILCACILLGVSVIVIYALFKEPLRERFAGTVFSRFFELGLRSTRWKYLKNVLQDFSFAYLGGGVHSKTVGVPHNFWLYVYDFGGIVPFAVYVIFTVVVAVSYVRFLLSKENTVGVKCFLSLLLSVLFVEFMLEDLLYALPSFVLIAHFVFGVICGLAPPFRKKSDESVKRKNRP